MKKAIIYARFSPRRNAEQCESIETQLELCRDYCTKNNIEILAEFADRALSGSEEDRPQLWQAVDSLKKGYLLICYRLDRLARSVYLSDIIERTVKKKGAFVVSISGEGTWSDTNEDWLVRKILQTLAEYERKVIAARTKAAMLRHQRNGRRMSGTPPFGFAVNPDDESELIVDLNEQKIITRILQLRQDGLGLRPIVRQLQIDGYTCRGKAFNHVTIGKIINRNG